MSNFKLMLKQGRAFSGFERNCCFLNTGGETNAGGRFANISAASGLDFADDGRAVAIVDWDLDGDLDLWVSNRNAPRLRFMRNDTLTANRFVAVRLEGNGRTTNRDAIGARVEVYIAGNDDQPLIKTLRAGEGFLAQSSKWLHFGLGSAESIDKLIVRWPGSDGSESVEEFSGLIVDRRYHLAQGNGKPVEVSPRTTQLAIGPSLQEIPAQSDTARIPLVTPLPTHKFRFPRRTGETPVSVGGGKPALITLWASWCAPCVEELAEFAERAEEIQSAGIEVVAMSVDKPEDKTSVSDAIQTSRFPFVSGMATERLVRLLQDYFNSLTGQELPMPIPVSFLIDANGRLAVVYKGRLQIDDLLADVAHSSGTRAERWVGSAQLAGRSIEHPKIQRIANLYDTTVYLRMGRSLIKVGRFEEAADYYREIVRIEPDQRTALNSLAWILSTHPNDEMRNGSEATQFATRLVNLSGETDARELDTLAASLAEVGRFTEAVSTARQAIAKARSENLDQLARTIEARVALYEQGKPYRMPQ